MPHGVLVKNIVPKNCVKYLSKLFSKPQKVLEFSINIATAYNLEQGNMYDRQEWYKKIYSRICTSVSHSTS